ncbi:MAG: radical SAM protein [Bacteroidales bacterium]|nr:radical SAM protein [Candidatus Latescibacterota bacterium]
MMRVKASAGNDDIARVFIAETDDGKMLEFVESVQPPIPREKKWVLIISTLYGCPGGCRFCDAGTHYEGKVPASVMMEQIDHLVRRRYPDGRVPAEKFKVQLARMGEPAFNDEVLDVLEQLPSAYDAPGLIPAISTIAPEGREAFFERLLKIRDRLYPERFQLQFSIHTTDLEKRDWLVPVKKWDFARIAAYGEKFYREGGRKITLNFALAEGMPIDPAILLEHFSPEKFFIKMTPVNPTCSAGETGLASHIVPGNDRYPVIEDLEKAGYEVLLSIGELEENHIGSNCGQYIGKYLADGNLEEGYNYKINEA